MNSLDEKKKSILLNKYHPLEVHWFGKGMNINESDYNLKTHISRLHSIYNRENETISRNFSRSMSPIAKLYGIDGLLTKITPETESKQIKREKSWNNNVKSPDSKSKRPSSANSLRREDSNNNIRKSQSNSSIDIDIEYTAINRAKLKEETKLLNLSNEERLTLGLYNLSAQQQQVYNQFVSMLLEFDDFDRNSILEDVNLDIQQNLPDISLYTGTNR
mmetsp:Transcript_12447/g.11281  ORF Transcript_12447/g.11281 Transcript_12447/m.11281 type:complete len:218 (+) Transcript_12447:24-677(+)